MSQTIWSTRPADLYGRRKRDRIYTALWSCQQGFCGNCKVKLLVCVSRAKGGRVVIDA